MGDPLLLEIQTRDGDEGGEADPAHGGHDQDLQTQVTTGGSGGHQGAGFWTFGLCSLCAKGGDCESDAGSLVDKPTDEELREQHPVTFSLLELAVREIFPERTCMKIKSILLRARQTYKSKYDQ